MNPILLVALAPLALPAPLGGIAVFRGSPGGPGDVVIVDPAGIQPPTTVTGLAGITLLPIEVGGRVELDALRPDRARLRSDVPGASRIQLGSGAGSLYRYSRPAPTGSAHGLFVVDSNGDARVLIERPGVGPTLDQSPFLGRIGVAPGGDELLVATRPEAGGDLLEVDVASATTIDRTSNVGVQTFLESSVLISSACGVAATNQGIFRFARASSGDAAAIAFPAPLPALFTGDIAFSRSGDYAVTSAGSDATHLHVYAFATTGSAVQVTVAEDAVASAGYLPVSDHGPYMAISDDGTRCAWRVDIGTAEIFLAEVPAGLPSANHWLTSNANYIDTIDEIGQVMFRIGTNVLIYSAGEFTPGAAPTIENLDFFEAQLPATGAPSIVNVTQTSGFAQPPFLGPADLKPSAVMAESATDALIFHNQRSGGSGDLLGVNPGQTGFTVLVPNVKSVEFIETAGAQVYVDLQRKQGTDPRQLYRFTAPFAPTNSPLLSVAGIHTFTRAAARSDGWLAWVETTAIKERLWRANPLSSTAQQLTDRQLFYGPAIGWAPGGELAFTVGIGGIQSIFAAWATTAPVHRLGLPVQPGFVLPGA